MSVLNIILGILLVIGGFSCMFTPFATFLSAGYYIAILLLVYGVFGWFTVSSASSAISKRNPAY